MTLSPPSETLRHLPGTPLLPKETIVDVTGFWLPQIFPYSSSLWVQMAASKEASWAAVMNPKGPADELSKMTKESVTQSLL